MKGKENLIPLNKRTKEEQREIAKMGGKKSGEVRREKKKLSEIFNWHYKFDFTTIILYCIFCFK